ERSGARGRGRNAGRAGERSTGRPPAQSNVDLAVPDASGRVVYSFDAFHRQRTARRESLAEYTGRELRKGVALLGKKRLSYKPHALVLPDLDASSGIRVFVRLDDDRMPAYNAPVVEVVSLDADDWDTLRYPEVSRTISASALRSWLSQVYPSGVMERTDPRTKRVYAIKSTQGQLSLTASGSGRDQRFAVLRGEITLTDEGPDGFSYRGLLEVVLAYPVDKPRVTSLKGVFEGVYPRFDRMRNRTRNLPLRAVFEFRPGASP
ncbi:MAG: hypothetical protein ABGZ17_20575, partial [Planctomycetaceae bacterium]